MPADSTSRRCGTTLGGRAALHNPCQHQPGHQGRCSWWPDHLEAAARYEHQRRNQMVLTPPSFRLADYQPYLIGRYGLGILTEIPPGRWGEDHARLGHRAQRELQHENTGQPLARQTAVTQRAHTARHRRGRVEGRTR